MAKQQRARQARLQLPLPPSRELEELEELDPHRQEERPTREACSSHSSTMLCKRGAW